MYLEKAEKYRVSPYFFCMNAAVGAAKNEKINVVGSKANLLAKTAPVKLSPIIK